MPRVQDRQERLTLVGEANTRSSRPDRALAPLPPHASGGRLAKILGLSVKQYLRVFDRRNLFTTPPPRWRSGEARASAERTLSSLPPGRGLVLLGSRVAAAFGMPYDTFHEYELDGHRVLILPHPSGLRTWNDPGAAERAQRAFRGMLSGHGISGEWLRSEARPYKRRSARSSPSSRRP